jgi:peptidyl-dipeptidase Dcp
MEDTRLITAIEHAMRDQLEAVDRIVGSTGAQPFETSVLELERSARPLTVLTGVFSHLVASGTRPGLATVAGEITGRLVRHRDHIMMNRALFAQVAYVHEIRSAVRDPESRRLVKDWYRDFVRAGAELGDAERRRLSDLNEKIAHACADFEHTLLHDSPHSVILDEDDLAGRPASPARAQPMPVRTRRCPVVSRESAPNATVVAATIAARTRAAPPYPQAWAVTPSRIGPRIVPRSPNVR